MRKKRVIVIGGGAAGMMAAITAATHGAEVTLLEKNEKTGKKIYITGKGRCNVTNACEKEAFFENVIRNSKFLYSAFYTFDNEMVMDFFEKAGCKLKIERGERVFPVSDHSSDIIAALNRELEQAGVNVLLNTEVVELLQQENRVSGVRLFNGKELRADAVIVATGGKSYAATGSTGDGYRFADTLGIQVKKPYPSLVAFEAEESWCKELQGLSLKNVSLRMIADGKTRYEGFGEMLFTHFGISGPLVLSASCHYQKAYEQAEKKRKDRTSPVIKVVLDLKPALTEEQLDKRILRDFEEAQNKAFKNALSGLLPSKLIPVMIALSQIDPEKKVNLVTRQERTSFVTLLKQLPLTVVATRGFSEAIITQGGIDVKEINPSTMEAKQVKGLYFAGEVLDVDAYTGGFNLQIAWSTGYLAGKEVSEYEL